jgi:hypothetical protein
MDSCYSRNVDRLLAWRWGCIDDKESLEMCGVSMDQFLEGTYGVWFVSCASNGDGFR